MIYSSKWNNFIIHDCTIKGCVFNYRYCCTQVHTAPTILKIMNLRDTKDRWMITKYCFYQSGRYSNIFGYSPKERYMSHDITKPTKWVCVHQRLRSAWASAQSDQSSLCAQLVAKDSRFLHADSEDSDQTGRMPRLIWVFAGRTLTLLVLSCCGSYVHCCNSHIP